jgi:hypothetical protein
MKECFLMTSYCDSELKIKVLNECLDNLEQFDIDICLHAHYPLSVDIQKRVKYYIYDYSNPIIYDNFLTHWKNHNEFKMTIDLHDYNYTALQQFRRGFDFLKDKYEKIIIINYDVIIEPQLFDNIIYSLDNHQVKLFYWNDKDKYNDKCNSTLIGLRSDINLDFVTMKNYLFEKKSADNEYEAEDFIDKYLSIFTCDKTEYIKYKDSFKQLIMYDSDSFHIENESGYPWYVYRFENFMIHVAQYYQEVAVFFHNIKKTIDVEIVSKNKHKYILTGDTLIYLDVIWEDIGQIDIFVDGEQVEKNIIESFKRKNSQLYKK